jgi:tetratricopeptide (TPR) repeat protein
MSLLMKALEKAAKDRGEAPQPQPAAAGAAAQAPAARTPKQELTLEPLASPAPAATRATEPAAPRSAAQARAERGQARAATVMQATARAAPAATAGPRIRPIVALSLVAGLVALALAVYFYLQITHPGLFIRRPPPAPLAQAPQPAPVQKPIATGSVVAPATPAESAAAALPRTTETRRPPPAAPAASTAQAPGSSIKVSAGSAEPQSDNRLVQAYAALQSGNLDAARQQYGDAARSDPRNINALLGLASVAMQQGRDEEASRLYFNVLELEPRNPYAQTGLIALLGRADPLSAEAKLKQLIAREPAATLYFTLGNLYADQSRWAEAQQAYFQAHHLEPANPDYAYNLAVGLEHVGQPRLAADFYRRAVEQARNRGRAGFDLARAQDRIRELAAQPQ